MDATGKWTFVLWVMSLFTFGFTRSKSSESNQIERDESLDADSSTPDDSDAECEETELHPSNDNDSSAPNKTTTSGEKRRRTSAGESSAPANKRKFRPGWKTDKRFSDWLQYDPRKGRMTCSFCLESGFKNNFTTGCGDMRRSALCRHETTSDHKTAVTNHAERAAFHQAAEHAISLEEGAIMTALKTTYFLAKEEIASSKLSALCDLLVMVNADGIKHLSREDSTRRGEQLTYRSNRSVTDFQKALSQVIEEDVLRKIEWNDVIGLMTDETSDITVTHKMIVYIRAIDPDLFEAREFFLADVELNSANAEGITKKVLEVLEEKKISTRKITGIGTDGAAVMSGKHSGFGARMQRQASPFALQVHCVAHRLALASGQAADTVSIVKQYQSTVNSLYNFFQTSTKRSKALHKMQEVYHDHEIALHATFSTRWLSFRGAVDAIRKSLPSLLQCLSEMNEEGDATATGHYRAVKKPTFILLTYLLSDVTNVLCKLSCLFQSEKLNFAAVQPLVKSTIATITNMKETPGQHLAPVLQKLVIENQDAEIVLSAEIMDKRSGLKSANPPSTPSSHPNSSTYKLWLTI